MSGSTASTIVQTCGNCFYSNGYPANPAPTELGTCLRHAPSPTWTADPSLRVANSKMPNVYMPLFPLMSAGQRCGEWAPIP